MQAGLAGVVRYGDAQRLSPSAQVLHASGSCQPIIRGASGPERPRVAMSSPASLPEEINQSAQRGELQKVVKWLREGGQVDALCPITTEK